MKWLSAATRAGSVVCLAGSLDAGPATLFDDNQIADTDRFSRDRRGRMVR